MNKTPQITQSPPPSDFSPAVRTILVVDDSHDDLTLLRLMFRRFRILNPVFTVSTVDDAVCYLKGEGDYADRKKYPFPTMLFVDLHLNGESGFDVLRWLQKHRKRVPLAVVVLSGSDLQAFKQAYALGADSFLVKPLRFDDFENLVRHIRGIKLTQTPQGFLVELDPAAA